MNWSRWVEVFEGTDKRLSMSRLLCFLSFFPATYVLITNYSSEALGWYLGAYAFNYVGGKLSECIKRRGNGDADSSPTQE